MRFEHNDLLSEASLTPRASVAYKLGKKAQFSAAYGEFRQAPAQSVLKFHPSIESERATHYLLNYQYSHDKQTFRVEAYEKAYDDLLRYDSPTDGNFTNDGYGYARGLDIFWRDGKTLKNLEYWVSYSFIDTERKYRDFREKATPGFVADHNLSVVTKYWINSLRSQLGVTYSFASGRPFDNPNKDGFMESRTPAFNNVSLGWAYLLDAQKILYFSASNVFNTANVFGYDYAQTAGDDGRFERQSITPTADRFFFIGFFWTISDDKKTNQLNQL